MCKILIYFYGILYAVFVEFRFSNEETGNHMFLFSMHHIQITTTKWVLVFVSCMYSSLISKIEQVGYTQFFCKKKKLKINTFAERNSNKSDIWTIPRQHVIHSSNHPQFKHLSIFPLNHPNSLPSQGPLSHPLCFFPSTFSSLRPCFFPHIISLSSYSIPPSLRQRAGCRRRTGPWRLHWRGQPVARWQTTPGRCSWKDASPLPAGIESSPRQPLSPPCSVWYWREFRYWKRAQLWALKPAQ